MIEKYFAKVRSLNNLKNKLGFTTEQFNKHCLGLSKFNF